MKRYMPIALAAILVLAMAVPTAAGPFADVPENHWAYEAVKQLAAYGLIEGFPDGTFKGAEPMTRYQMAMVVARLLVSLDAQIKAEIEAAKAGVTPPPAPAPAAAPTEKIIEKETVTVEKPIIEKVIEKTIVEKLKTEELDALAAKVAAVEGKVANVEGAVDAVSGKVDEVDKKADDANAKLVELDGAIALLEGELSVKALDLETKAAAGDADLAEKLAAIKAELEEKIAAGDNQLSAAIEAKAKEFIVLIDALKTEFGLELTALGVRVVALEEQLALANAKIVDLEQKLGAVDEKATAIGAKLDAHIAGHEKVTISGSSEVVLSDVDIYAPWDLTWNEGTGKFEGSVAWKDPNDIFDTGPHSDGAYYPGSVFEHKLNLTLTAKPADDVVVSVGLATVKNLFAGSDVTNFALDNMSLEVKTPGMLAQLNAGGAVLPEGSFTAYTMTGDMLEDDYGDPAYEGVVAQVKYGKFSGTTLFLRPSDDVGNETPAVYVCAADGKVSLTDNLKLGVAYVRHYEDPQSIDVANPGYDPHASYSDTVLSVYGSFTMAPGWTVSGEFAKDVWYGWTNPEQGYGEDDSGTATKIDVTGKVGSLELAGNVTRVEYSFYPDFVNLDPDNGGIQTDIKSISIDGKLPIGKLELSGGYKVEGDADQVKDWDEWKTNTATAGAKYETLWGALRVTPSADLNNTLYVKDPAGVYADNVNVFKLTGGVKGEYVAKFKTDTEDEVVPITAEYTVTSAGIKESGGAAEPYYTKSVFDLNVDYGLTDNLKLTGGYKWTRMEDKLDVEYDNADYGVVDYNNSVFKAGAEANFQLTEATKATGSYNYEIKKNLAADTDVYKKSILKTGLSSQLTAKASIDAKAEFYALMNSAEAVYSPLNNLIAELNYTYNITTNTTLKLGYKVVKSDKTEGDDSLVDYTARIISGSLKVTF
ncbi:MAG: S-layer homology domain-containing protein [Bacillota bacterium]|nr:S-layer homology domain-containing protein [Bacillota bacterium]